MYKSKLTRKIVPVDLLPTVNILLILVMLRFFMGGRPVVRCPIDINPPLTSSNLIDSFISEGATILIAQGKVMLELPDSSLREQALKQMGIKYGISFSSAELSTFGTIDVIGTPVHDLKNYIKTYYNPQDYYAQKGISIDTVSNELFNWLYAARKAYAADQGMPLGINIKADKNTSYALIKRVIGILQSQKINKFSLITLVTSSKYTDYE
jgi:biopolymer transport protein ExbD